MRRSTLVFLAAILAGVGLSVEAVPAAARAGSTTSAAAYDVSYPQCGSRLPSGGNTAVVGVTDGLPWSTNPCLASEYAWAAGKPQPAQLYMNTANPETASAYWSVRAGSGPHSCRDLNNPADLGCAYNYGYNSAQDALSRATSAVGTAAATKTWWLDVETANSWNGTAAANSQGLQGSIDYLLAAGAPAVGFYSTGYQWGVITGGWKSSNSDWIAGASGLKQAQSWCAPSQSFSGGPVRLVQYPSGGFDGDYIC